MSVTLERRGANIRFGAAVYGSFLVASVVGIAFEAGQDARVMTTTALGSALVSWLAHWWSVGCSPRRPPRALPRSATRSASGRSKVYSTPAGMSVFPKPG